MEHNLGDTKFVCYPSLFLGAIYIWGSFHELKFSMLRTSLADPDHSTE